MQRRRDRRLAGTIVVSLAVAASLLRVTPGQATPVPGAPACPVTPADSFWHADVSALPVHPQSATWVASVGPTAKLKADFGSGTWDGGPIGIPFTTVPGTQPRVPVTFEYADESDPGPYPIPPNAPIEGGPASTGDRHVLVVDRDACRLWEVYSAYPQNGGASWAAGSGATWDLRSNAMRPLGWTSGDAAGLPILPGLVRQDEVAAGTIDHAIRVTAPRTANSYVWPASHKAATGGAADPPMGAWFRLKASFDISGFSAANQVVLRALKQHGMVLADNGSPWFLSGAPDPGWNDDDLQRSCAPSPAPPSRRSTCRRSRCRLPRTLWPGPRQARPPRRPCRRRPRPPGHPRRPRRPPGRRRPGPPCRRRPRRPPTPTTTTTATTTTTRPPDDDHDDHQAADDHDHGAAPAGAQPDHQPRLRVGTGEVEHRGQPHLPHPHLRRRPQRVVLGPDRSDDLDGRSRAGRLAQHRLVVGGRGDLRRIGLGQAPAGRTITLRLREYRGSTVVQFRTVVVTATGAWQQVAVSLPPAEGGTSISVDVLVSLTTSLKAQVDDVTLRRARPLFLDARLEGIDLLTANAPRRSAMADPKQSQSGEQEAESEADPADGGTLNDPLTHTDVKAPRVPFEPAPDS